MNYSIRKQFFYNNLVPNQSINSVIVRNESVFLLKVFSIEELAIFGVREPSRKRNGSCKTIKNFAST